MPYRKTTFTNGKIYHIYNRSNADEHLFTNKRDYERATESLVYYTLTNPPLRYSHFKRLSKERKGKMLSDTDISKTNIDVIAYIFMSDHFHLLVKQNIDDGISNTIRNFQNSYAKYYNTKQSRHGVVFRPMFKAMEIENENQTIQISRYIHLNPVEAGIINIKRLYEYPWSSYSEYLNPEEGSMLKPQTVLSQFQSPKEYEKYVLNEKDYKDNLANIQSFLIDK